MEEKRLISNAFSLNMLAVGATEVCLTVRKLTKLEAEVVADDGYRSVIGHADTAAVFGEELNRTFPVNRETVTLDVGDSLLVGQYRGPRLPEGATTLPEGATIEWFLVEVLDPLL